MHFHGCALDIILEERNGGRSVEELNALEGQSDFSPKKRGGGSSSISGRGNPGIGTVRNSPQKVLESSRFFGYNRVTKRTFC